MSGLDFWGCFGQLFIFIIVIAFFIFAAIVAHPLLILGIIGFVIYKVKK